MIDRNNLPNGDWVLGSNSVNAFNPPRQSSAHSMSLCLLLMLAQRRRNERQTAVEVGCWQGASARVLLHNMPFLTLHCVDPWKAGDPGTDWYDNGDRYAKRSQSQFDLQHDLVCEMAEQFKPRCIVHRLPSLEAAPLFADASLDLVFIDGAHTYEAVRADLFAWRKKTRSGGWLTAHDYRESGNYFGVINGCKSATDEMGLKREIVDDKLGFRATVMPGKVMACRIP